jgi:hypothetical protein
MAFDGKSLDDYIDVPTRIAEFREKHPEASLQPADPAKVFEIVEVGGATFIVYVAAAYRTPDDPRPGIGTAWEPVPGRTPYTRNSELMNAETSAWGRAIIAALAADAKKGIASQQEVRNRRAERDQAPAEQDTDHDWLKDIEARIQVSANRGELAKLAREISAQQKAGKCEQVHADRLWELGRRRQEKLGIHTNKDGGLSRSRMSDEALANEGAMTKEQAKEHNALRRSGEPPKGQVETGPLPPDDDPWTTPAPTDEKWVGPLTGDRDE